MVIPSPLDGRLFTVRGDIKGFTGAEELSRVSIHSCLCEDDFTEQKSMALFGYDSYEGAV